jgi:hypothetical protein
MVGRKLHKWSSIKAVGNTGIRELEIHRRYVYTFVKCVKSNYIGLDIGKSDKWGARIVEHI